MAPNARLACSTPKPIAVSWSTCGWNWTVAATAADAKVPAAVAFGVLWSGAGAATGAATRDCGAVSGGQEKGTPSAGPGIPWDLSRRGLSGDAPGKAGMVKLPLPWRFCRSLLLMYSCASSALNSILVGLRISMARKLCNFVTHEEFL